MMLTRCPACQTVFRLGPEQLHARRGEVRCGHCFQPFNALEHEITQREHAGTPPAAAARPSARPAAPTERPPEAKAPPASFAGEPAPHAAPHSPPPASAAALAPTLDFIIIEEKPTPADASNLDFTLPDDFFARQPKDTPAEPRKASEPARTDPIAPVLPEVVRSVRRPAAEAPQRPPEAQAVGATSVDTPEPRTRPPSRPAPASRIEPSAPAAEPTITAPAAQPAAEQANAKPAYVDFDQLDAKYGRPRKPANPTLHSLTTLAVSMLGGLLAAQSLYLYRMEIARDLPGLRPVLSAVCAVLGCEVAYPRNPERIGLDASDLQSEPGKPGQYILHATVNNRADYAQAWPHMELTLTDARDTPIARRVLTPEQWVPSTQQLSAFSGRSAVSARIAFAAPDLAPTGYRVYIFYP